MAVPTSSITVNDGAATPVAQTFSITDRTGLVSTFRNVASALIRGAQNFVHEVRLGKTPTAANRVLMSLTCPVEGTVDGQTVVLRSSLFRAECNFSPESPEAERLTHLVLFSNLLAQADVKLATHKGISLG
jgi:hypothetical protein